MHLLISAVAALSVATSALATNFNTSQEYILQTQLKPNQIAKGRFSHLYVVASHTGAGLNDAVLYSNKSFAAMGFLNSTNLTNPDGGFYSRQEFDLSGGQIQWGMSIAYANLESAWEPVRISANGIGGSSAFFINETGLQWADNAESPKSTSQFGGWLVCDWWHGVPQLFVKLKYVFSDEFNDCTQDSY